MSCAILLEHQTQAKAAAAPAATSAGPVVATTYGHDNTELARHVCGSEWHASAGSSDAWPADTNNTLSPECSSGATLATPARHRPKARHSDPTSQRAASRQAGNHPCLQKSPRCKEGLMVAKNFSSIIIKIGCLLIRA